MQVRLRLGQGCGCRVKPRVCTRNIFSHFCEIHWMLNQMPHKLKSSGVYVESSIKLTGIVECTDTMCTGVLMAACYCIHYVANRLNSRCGFRQVCHRESSTWLQLVQRCYCRALALSRFGTCKKVTYYREHGRRARLLEKTQKKDYVPIYISQDMSFLMWYILWNIPEFLKQKLEK